VRGTLDSLAARNQDKGKKLGKTGTGAFLYPQIRGGKKKIPLTQIRGKSTYRHKSCTSFLGICSQRQNEPRGENIGFGRGVAKVRSEKSKVSPKSTSEKNIRGDKVRKRRLSIKGVK